MRTISLKDHRSQKDLKDILDSAYTVATKTLDDVDQHRSSLVKLLDNFINELNNADTNFEKVITKEIDVVIGNFRDHYDALCDKLGIFSKRISSDLDEAYSDLKADAHYITIMLFGRTRAGKSTTMEALTEGNGDTIGIGRQHTTTEIKAYYYPPHAKSSTSKIPSLRIVDTPGIEGFKGEELTLTAEKFIERSDYIFFLLTEDKATSGELDRFGQIRTQGKGVTVLLNVKTSLDDIVTFISDPSYIYKENELAGHKNRIENYLASHFSMQPPKIIPYHAYAAHIARSPKMLPNGLDSRSQLLELSRLQGVENEVIQFIRDDAIPSRRRVPRDLLNNYLWNLKDELRPYAGIFKQVSSNLKQLSEQIERSTNSARQTIIKRFALFKMRFETASEEVAGIVDEIISARGNGHDLEERWDNLMQSSSVSDSVDWFISAGTASFQEELAEEISIEIEKFRISSVEDLQDTLDEYYTEDDKTARNKYARAGIRVGVGSGVGALATYAVANFWNPTGWVAAVATVAVAAVSIGSQEVARTATDKWHHANKRQLATRRNEIVHGLKDRLWEDYRNARKICDKWLDETKDAFLKIGQNAARPVIQTSEILWHTTVNCLQNIDEIGKTINTSFVREIIKTEVPEIRNESVTIVSVVREPGIATKILLQSSDPKIKALGVCIGRGAERLQRISRDLGGENICFVDQSAEPRLQILQALGLYDQDIQVVEFTPDCSVPSARIKINGLLAAKAIGTGGHNVRMSSELLHVKLSIGDRS